MRDTTGAGDAFFAGVAIGMTYGKELKEAVEMCIRDRKRTECIIIVWKINSSQRFDEL